VTVLSDEGAAAIAKRIHERLIQHVHAPGDDDEIDADLRRTGYTDEELAEDRRHREQQRAAWAALSRRLDLHEKVSTRSHAISSENARRLFGHLPNADMPPSTLVVDGKRLCDYTTEALRALAKKYLRR
jgi:hypothetical protein